MFSMKTSGNCDLIDRETQAHSAPNDENEDHLSDCISKRPRNFGGITLIHIRFSVNQRFEKIFLDNTSIGSHC